MRVVRKEILDKKIMEEILIGSSVGRLATNGKDGYPVIKPLNYVYLNGLIYFHSACSGEKIDDIAMDDRVCFEVDIPVRYVKADKEPCSASYRYQSVILRGKARIIAQVEEKKDVLLALMKKYQPEGGYGLFLADKLAMTAVIGIDIIDLTGKEDLR
jgi:uncharacterized protein